jgi:hypothetical protein
MTLSGQAIVIGTLPKSKVPFQSTQSKIERSLVSPALTSHGVAPVSEPACLTKSDPRWLHDRSPLLTGCDKHCKPHDFFPRRYCDAAVQMIRDEVLNHVKPIYTPTPPRTYVDAVKGFSAQTYPPLNMETSPGFPTTLTFKKKEDCIFLTRDPISQEIVDVDFDSRLMNRLLDEQQMRELGAIPPTLFWDHLKDERRPPEKF